MSRVSDKPYFLYVLWSANAKRFYIGIAEDPQARLEQHNAGIRRSWTHRHRPWELILKELHADYTAARKRERLLKAQKGGVGFFRMTGIDPEDYPRR